MEPQMPYGYWNQPAGISKLTGKSVTVKFRDGKSMSGRVLSADGDLGTITLSWQDGPRCMSCTFKTQDTLSVVSLHTGRDGLVDLEGLINPLHLIRASAGFDPLASHKT